MRFIIFLAVLAVVGAILVKPITEHGWNLFPDKATKEEVQSIGNVSGLNRRVQELQQMLLDLDFYDGPVDGIISEKTRLALMVFQQRNYIDATGKFDLQTLSQLRQQALSRPKAVPVKKIDRLPARKSPYQIKEIQSLLKKEGFYKGEIDGKVGQGTVRAIKQFQKSRNLQESGVVNVKTTHELRKLETGR